MHKRRVNELKLAFVIAPAGPILIKSGDDGGLNPMLPTMSFVRTRHPQTGQETIYLPGSSLKGVMRSHSERILQTVFPGDSKLCCDPLARRGNCFDRTRDIKETDKQYRSLCLACRTFGHMANASHFLTADAYPAAPINALPVRQNVAIDRLSGGVAVGPFDMEVALAGEFHTTLTLFNFELWQLGLIALTLRDMMEGRVRIGFAKSRGLGEISVRLKQLEIGYPGQFEADAARFYTQMFGVGALAPDLREPYGYVNGDDALPLPPGGTATPGDTLWGRPAVVFQDEQITAVLATAVQAWADLIKTKQGQR
jgi:CRISPR/Cas system CSM-associated protein Csm3 (group 7 of RAMP superfamily)